MFVPAQFIIGACSHFDSVFMMKETPNYHTLAAARRDEDSTTVQRRTDRVDKHNVSAHVETAAYREFKLLAAEQLKTTDALVHEALALLFGKYGRPVPPPIAKKLKRLGIAE